MFTWGAIEIFTVLLAFRDDVMSHHVTTSQGCSGHMENDFNAGGRLCGEDRGTGDM